MTVLQALQQSGRARVFAALALLCVFGLQSVEASHSHAHLDSAVECLACTSSAAAVLPVFPESFIVEAGTYIAVAGPTSMARETVFRFYDSRGPPHIS